MDKTEGASSEPVDSLTAASRWSKVSKKSNNKLTHFYWFAGAVVAIAVVLMMCSGHDANDQGKSTSNISNNDYSSALSENLDRLKALEQQVPQARLVSNRVFVNSSIGSQRPSKEYLARQNAPTSMYTGSGSQRQYQENGQQAREATLAGEGSNSQFANTAMVTTSIQAKRVQHPGFTIVSGEFLHAVLETAIDSDLPGMVRAVVSKPVYSYTGEREIIPSGSRLIGQYLSSIVQGQDRVMIVWNRVVLPSGIAVQINSTGTDALGRAGQGADSVNRHFFARFGESTLLSLLAAGTSTAGVGNSDQYNSASQYRIAIAQSFQQSAQKSLQGTEAMKPTIHIHQGANINVFVAHDLSFYRVLKSNDDEDQSTMLDYK